MPYKYANVPISTINIVPLLRRAKIKEEDDIDKWIKNKNYYFPYDFCHEVDNNDNFEEENEDISDNESINSDNAELCNDYYHKNNEISYF